MNVSEVVLVKDSMNGGDFGLGVLMGAAGLGLLVGSLLGGAWVERRPMAEAYSTAIAAMALGAGLTAISPTVWVAAAVPRGLRRGERRRARCATRCSCSGARRTSCAGASSP